MGAPLNKNSATQMRFAECAKLFGTLFIRPDPTCLEVNNRAVQPAAVFSGAQILPHRLLEQATCSVDQLLALAPARHKEQRVVACWAALFSTVRPQLKLKSQHLLDLELLVPAVGLLGD